MRYRKLNEPVGEFITRSCSKAQTWAGGHGTRAARMSVALLASMLRFVCESGAKASGLLLILAAAAGRATDFLAARVAALSALMRVRF